MIRRKAQMEKEVRERMREGKGCSMGWHLHDGEEGIFSILSGTGRVSILATILLY